MKRIINDHTWSDNTGSMVNSYFSFVKTDTGLSNATAQRLQFNVFQILAEKLAWLPDIWHERKIA